MDVMIPEIKEDQENSADIIKCKSAVQSDSVLSERGDVWWGSMVGQHKNLVSQRNWQLSNVDDEAKWWLTKLFSLPVFTPTMLNNFFAVNLGNRCARIWVSPD